MILIPARHLGLVVCKRAVLRQGFTCLVRGETQMPTMEAVIGGRRAQWRINYMRPAAMCGLDVGLCVVLSCTVLVE
jgi:hypothetical protein